MPPSKKKNKQRKQKSGSKNSGGSSNGHGNNVCNAKGKQKNQSFLKMTGKKMSSGDDLMRRCFDKHMKSISPKDTVKRVGQGMGLSSHIVGFLTTPHASTFHHRYLQQMVDAGLVSVILGLLSRCEDAFLDVIETDKTFPYGLREVELPVLRGEVVEGYVSTPVFWIDILRGLACCDLGLGSKRLLDCRIEISRGIEPLVKCLSNDIRREFFKRRVHWYDALLPFMNLIYILGGTKEDKYSSNTIPILVQHKGLLDGLVHCVFWGQERPDIMKESDTYRDVLNGPKEDIFAQASYLAGSFIDQVLASSKLEDDYKCYFDGEGKKCNMSIGKTLVVNEDYDPDCEVPFISGLIGLLQGSSNKVMTNEHFLERQFIINMMRNMIISGCVDKNVLAGVVYVGRNSVKDYDEAELIMKAAFESTHSFIPGKNVIPQDSYFAVAIGAGLFEMILEVLSRFENRPDEDELFTYMGIMLEGAQSVSLHQHSKKATALRQDSIKKALEACNNNSTRVGSDAVMRKYVVNIIRSISDLNGGQDKAESTPMGCWSCMKPLSSRDRSYCSKCGVACYCSKKCQVEHWKNRGHKNECKSLRKYSGKKETRKIQAHYGNISKICNKIYVEKRSSFLIEATVKGIDICDCVVKIDLTRAPPLIELVKSEEFPGFRSSFGQQMKQGHLMFMCIERDAEDARTRLTPDGRSTANATCKRVVGITSFVPGIMPWGMAQDQLRDRFCGQLEKLCENPELGERFLDQLQSALG